MECPREVREFVVANVVGSADVGFKVRLEGLARMHSRFCTVSISCSSRKVRSVLKIELWCSTNPSSSLVSSTA